MTRLALMTLAFIWMLGPNARAATFESKCQAELLKAAAQFQFCYRSNLSKLTGSSIFGSKYVHRISRCHKRYTATWPKLRAKAALAGTTCDNQRFASNGDGTVTDRLSGLQWEQKTDDGTVHDKDNLYSWSAGGAGGTAGDGTVFTSFLPMLVGGCFAGHCDWRLPTMAELLTLLSESFPCTASPCIDPIFGPTAANPYWSSETAVLSAIQANCVDFTQGNITSGVKLGSMLNDRPARAVRGGP